MGFSRSSQPIGLQPRPEVCYFDPRALAPVAAVTLKIFNSGGVELSIDKESQSAWSEGFSLHIQLIGSKC